MSGYNFILIIILAISFTFLFTHMNYKKYHIFTTLNEVLMFKKMLFNKKLANCAGKKTIISYSFIVCYCFIHATVLMTIDFISLYHEPYLIDALISLFFFIVIILILRLIYEFIIVPIGVNNNQSQVYQQNIYMHQFNNQQPFNTPYPQQNYTMPQNQATTYVQPLQPVQPVNNVEPNNVSSLQTEQNSQTAEFSEAQFQFCSQCGTRYSVSESKCPNCSMQ